MNTTVPPFSRVLVPYDGSEPSRAALAIALKLAARGTEVAVVTVVDETPVFSQSSMTILVYDPTPLMDALDAQGALLLADAAAAFKAANLTATTEIVHEMPVAGILSAAEKHACDVIIMGTHARTGMARTFLGSTTDGVLRMSSVPVITVRTGDRSERDPFAVAVVAIDDSEPADAALELSAKLARTQGTQIVGCHVIDTHPLYENAMAYGFSPEELSTEVRREGEAIVRRALDRAGLPAQTPAVIVQGDAAEALVAAADERKATLLVIGTHGRRGLRRLVLGSVAEGVVRRSDVPVLVVPAKRA